MDPMIDMERRHDFRIVLIHFVSFFVLFSICGTDLKIEKIERKMKMIEIVE